MNNQRTKKHGVKIEKSTAIWEEIDEAESRYWAFQRRTTAKLFPDTPLPLKRFIWSGQL